MNYETFVQSHSVGMVILTTLQTRPSEYLKVTQSTKRARARGMGGNVVLMLKIPIELQCDYSGGLLLQIT